MKDNTAAAPPGGKPPFYKRKFLIAKSDQLKFIFSLSAIIIALITISSFELYRLMDEAIRELMFSIHIKAKTLGEVLIPIVMDVNVIYIAATAAGSVVLVSFTMYKLSSLLGALDKDLESIARSDFRLTGNYPKKGIAGKMMGMFDEMVASLKKNISQLSVSSSRLIAIVEEEEVDVSMLKKEMKIIKETLGKIY